MCIAAHDLCAFVVSQGRASAADPSLVPVVSEKALPKPLLSQSLPFIALYFLFDVIPQKNKGAALCNQAERRGDHVLLECTGKRVL